MHCFLRCWHHRLASQWLIQVLWRFTLFTPCRPKTRILWPTTFECSPSSSAGTTSEKHRELKQTKENFVFGSIESICVNWNSLCNCSVVDCSEEAAYGALVYQYDAWSFAAKLTPDQAAQISSKFFIPKFSPECLFWSLKLHICFILISKIKKLMI